MLVVSIVFGSSLVFILGLSCLGVKLAKDLNEQDNPKPTKKELTSHQKAEMARIKILLEEAEKEDRKETHYVLTAQHWDIIDARRDAKKYREEARKIAKKAGIRLEE